MSNQTQILVNIFNAKTGSYLGSIPAQIGMAIANSCIPGGLITKINAKSIVVESKDAIRRMDYRNIVPTITATNARKFGFKSK